MGIRGALWGARVMQVMSPPNHGDKCRKGATTLPAKGLGRKGCAGGRYGVNCWVHYGLNGLS